MNIPDTGVGSKEDAGRGGLGAHISAISRDWVLGAIILLTASLCFGLGVIAAKETQKPGDTLWIEQLPEEVRASTTSSKPSIKVTAPPAAAVVLSGSGEFIASKSGTKYYLPSCSGAKRIKEENRVWFKTKAEAEAAGYGPATGCKGL